MEERTLYIRTKRWLEQYKKNSVKPTTYDRLETSLSLLQDYPISRMDILDLTEEDLQEYINQMVDDGYALSTIRKQYHLVSAYLKYAMVKGDISRPIYEEAKLPNQTSVKKKAREVISYSQIQQAVLKKELRTYARPGYAAALLMLETGMRIGECLALSWGDILWDRRAININKTLIRITNRRKMEVQGSAKSYTSNRIIPMSTEAMRVLRDLAAKGTDGYIFAGEDGKPISYEAMRYQIQRACDVANVPYFGQHAFRHTFATNCYYRGCDVKILSKLLGHSDVTITYNIYIHLFGDALEEMRSVLG